MGKLGMFANKIGTMLPPGVKVAGGPRATDSWATSTERNMTVECGYLVKQSWHAVEGLSCFYVCQAYLSSGVPRDGEFRWFSGIDGRIGRRTDLENAKTDKAA